jgi:transcriptional regulator with XRE-family HTH domain
VTKEYQRKPINRYRIDHADWQVYFQKIFEMVPRETLADKHLWIADKIGVSSSSTTSWLAKGTMPRMENLFSICELLLRLPLETLITDIQQGQDPPALSVGAVNRKMIDAISQIPETDLEMIGKSLEGISRAELYDASSNLVRIASTLKS